MKTCPYCAEDIQDAAIKCRYCGSWLPGSEGLRPPEEPAAATAPEPSQWGPTPSVEATPTTTSTSPAIPTSIPTPAAWTPIPAPTSAGPSAVVPGMGAQRFSHSGERYVLGYGQGFFGIWDRGVAGGPVLSFPRTDDGWQQVWNRYLALEPRAVEVVALNAGSGAPAVTPVLPEYRPGRVLTRSLVALLAVVVAGAVLEIVFDLLQVGLLHRIEAEGDAVSFAAREASVHRLNVSNTILSLSLLATVIVWLVWQYRVRSNLDALGATKLDYSLGWNIGWWFVPFANLAIPFLAMREIDRSSAPQAEAGAEAGAGAGEASFWSRALLPLWWTAYVVQLILFSSAAAIGRETGATASEHVSRHIVLAIASFALIVAAALATAVVLRIDRRQEARRAEAASAPPPAAVDIAPAASEVPTGA